MITAEQLKQKMANQYAEEVADVSLELWGKSVEEILKQASVELGVPIHMLEYEILIKGSHGFLGTITKKAWKLLVYPSQDYTGTVKHTANTDMNEGHDTAQAEKVISVDGDFGIHLDTTGAIYLRVTPPQGIGNSVDYTSIEHQLSRFNYIPALSKEIIDDIIQQATGEWVQIGEYNHNSANDSKITISISEDEMSASVILSTPTQGGATVTEEQIMQALSDAGVFFGFKKEAITKLVHHPIFRVATVVAEGEPPVNGTNLHLEYLFEVQKKKSLKPSKDGKVDFKSLSNVQNISEGQAIANVIPPIDGTPGKDVRGASIPAKDGENVDLILGENVQLNEDGTQAIAMVDGQAVVNKGVLSVEKVMVIAGDLKNHIDFLGSVIIKGNVEDGYTLNVKGDLHIFGTVGHSSIMCGGNLIVEGGINGARGLDENASMFSIRCNKSIWAKFIQNCFIRASEFIVVSDGILNSDVVALGKVLCHGRRAAIMGGIVRACEEINAATLGSASGTATHLEVGENPDLKDELAVLNVSLEELSQSLEDLSRSISNWEQAAKTNALPPDKQRKLESMREEQTSLAKNITKLSSKIAEKTEVVNRGIDDARISASAKVNVGVVLNIHNIEFTVTNEYNKPTTFVEINGLINTKIYDAISDDISKKE
jgi:uncharacterized protein (DUF342 family)